MILIGNKHQSVKCVRRKDMSLEEDTRIAGVLPLALKNKKNTEIEMGKKLALKKFTFKLDYKL